jgi:hypothetical protein
MPPAAAAGVAAWRVPDPDWLMSVNVRTGHRRRYEAHRAQVASMASAIDNGKPHPGMHREGRRDQHKREQIKVDNSKLVKSILDIAKKSYDRQVQLYHHGTLDKAQTARGSKGFQDRTRSTQTQTTGNAFSVQSQNEPLRRETQRSLNVDNARLVRRLMQAKPSPEIARNKLESDYEKSRGYMKFARKLCMELPNPAERVLDYDASLRLKRRSENREKLKAPKNDLPPLARPGVEPAAAVQGPEKKSSLEHTPRIAQEIAGLVGEDEELQDIMATLGTSSVADSADPSAAGKQVHAPKGKPLAGGRGRPAPPAKPAFSGTSQGWHPAPQLSKKPDDRIHAPEMSAVPSPPKSPERPSAERPPPERPSSMDGREREPSDRTPAPSDHGSSKPATAEINAQVATDFVFKDIVPLSFEAVLTRPGGAEGTAQAQGAGDEGSDAGSEGSVDLAVAALPAIPSPRAQSESFEEDFDEYVESVASEDHEFSDLE